MYTRMTKLSKHTAAHGSAPSTDVRAHTYEKLIKHTVALSTAVSRDVQYTKLIKLIVAPHSIGRMTCDTCVQLIEFSWF